MGAIEKEIKPSEMTNEWISYIGGFIGFPHDIINTEINNKIKFLVFIINTPLNINF